MILSDFISPDIMVARSVNLERDMGSEPTLQHYHLTGKGLEILNRLISGLNGERVSAWSLTGPYGMGKSSFVNFLMALCGPEADEQTKMARRMLREKNRHLAGELHYALIKHFSNKGGLFRVAVTSSFEAINSTLAHGLRRALMAAQRHSKEPRRGMADLIVKVEELCAQPTPETTRLMEMFRGVRKVFGTPIALVIDEFGKNLEYMARFPAQGDLFILQALAETEDIFIWVCLHQAFEEYTSRLSARQLQEWGKIQGRFEDISFVEPKSEMIRFICETLARKGNDPFLNGAVREWASYFHHQARELNLAELKDLDVGTIERLYPLHPLTALVLPELCVRFAQNDRTLFAFLCSGEPSALPAYLAGETIEPASRRLATFGLERLYDYFLASSSAALMNRPESHRWIEIHDIIERSRNIDPVNLAVLKVIGLLNLIAGPSRFRSSDKLVSFAFLRSPARTKIQERDLRKVIAENMEKGVLIYREYADEYRLWEGTDFDIPAAIRERKALLATQPLEGVLKETLPLPLVTASKHSYVTGTLRHLERRWCGLSQPSEEAAVCSSSEVDGLILQCFGREPEPPAFPSRTQDGRPLILCYAACEDQIRELVLDAAAAKAVLRESPELVHDGVARKEARFRAQAAEERLRGYLATLFAPGNSEADWYVMGIRRELASHRDLSRAFSDCCDATYADCPVIRNELINRTRLSSAAASARRALMEAMVINEAREMLGLEGTGPEVAVYRTMLLAEGLHRRGENGAWEFAAPEPSSHYHPVWKGLTEAMGHAGETAVPVPDLVRMLRNPPFGMKEGPIPILLCLFLIVNSDELALYQEGAFVPSLGPEEMELLTKRPEYFTIRRFEQAKLRGQVFQVYMSLLKTRPAGDGRQLRNVTLISVVGPLVQFVKGLQPYVLQTRSLGRHAQNVRHVLQQARDPVELLFADIPQAVDLPIFDDANPVPDDTLEIFRARFTQAIRELQDAYPKLIGGIRQVILRAFGSNSDEASQLRTQLQQRAACLLDRCGDRGLKPFLATLTNFSGSDDDWLVSLATIATQRPVDSWRDADLQGFPVRLRDLSGRFSALETLVSRGENTLPTADGGREPRMVSLTRADGRTSSSIIWIDEVGAQNAQSSFDMLIREAGSDKAKLEAVFLLLGEHLLSGRLEASEEGNND